MKKKEEKAKVGRPKLADGEMKKKATVYIAIAFALLMVFAIGGTYSLYGSFSSNKLKGALTSSSSGCTIYASNIETTSAEMYWRCTGSVFAKSFTTYRSNVNGRVDSKVERTHNLKTYPFGNGWGVKNLLAGNYYIFSIKLSNGNVINKLFRTPTRDYLPGDKIPTSYISVSNITQNSAKFSYHLQGCHAEGGIRVYKWANSKWQLHKEFNANYNGTYILNGLSASTKYRINIKTNKNTLIKDFITSKATTTKKTTVNKYFTVKFNANGGTGTMSNQYIMHGDYNNNKSTKLSSNKFTKSGYVFAGWRAKRSADGKWFGYNSSNKKGWYSQNQIRKYYVYANGQGVSRTVAPKATVTMYAQWKVSQNKNTTTKKVSGSSCSTYKSQKTCVGSKQGNWQNTCVWRQNACHASSATAYRVVYNKNNRNATGTMTDQYITYGVSTKLRKNGFTLNGYTFAGWRAVRNKDGYVYGKDKNGKDGWYNSSNLKSVNYYKDQVSVAKTVAAGETVTMYAQWKAAPQSQQKSYTVFRIEQNTKKNCFNVYAPSNASYWRVQVFYKSAGASSYGTNKIFSSNHYNDNIKSQVVCFNKGYGDYRILVKKTTGSNDKANGAPTSWKPAGGSANSSIGWAYKDYNGYRPK